MNTNVINAICEQIALEFSSAFLYLSFSADMAAQGYRGAAKWFRLQYQEECAHALQFMDYAQQRGSKTPTPAIPAYPLEGLSLKEAFTRALAHERKVTQAINDLMTLCVAEKDYAAQNFLMGFVAEQVEEEDSVAEILDLIHLSESCTGALMHIDTKLGSRQG